MKASNFVVASAFLLVRIANGIYTANCDFLSFHINCISSLVYSAIGT